MKNNIKTVFDILSELNYILNKTQKRQLIGVFFVLTISSFFELLGVTAILPFIQVVLTPEKLLGNPHIAVIVNFLGIVSAKELMIFFGIGIILLYLVKNAYMLFSYYIQYDFATKVQKELAVKTLYSYLQRPYQYFLNINSSDILRDCSVDPGKVYNIIEYLFGIAAELLTMLLISGVIVYTDPIMAIEILIWLGAVMAGMVFFFKPIAKRAGRIFRSAEAEKNKAVYQTINGIKEIYVMQRKQPFLDAYNEIAEVSRKAQRTNSLISNSPDRIVEGICIGGLIGIVCVRLFLSDDMTEYIPKLAMLAMSAFKILPSVGKITSRVNGLVFCRQSLTNEYEIMKGTKHDSEKLVFAKRGSDASDKKIHFRDTLFVSNIFWKYETQKLPVLTNVSLEIKKGKSIALIGASGSGKTTLSDIILGLLMPQGGSVTADGTDVYSMPMEWANIVGYVPQTIFLLDGTVRENIIFGLSDSKADDAKIWKSLERAQLKEFVEKLPQQLDTMVGERGIKFSGGQRQRIAIARALYNEPEILVLDEATAALDNDTESAVMESIEALHGKITLIIVAHRLETIKCCDEIYEIIDGKAVKREKEEIWK